MESTYLFDFQGTDKNCATATDYDVAQVAHVLDKCFREYYAVVGELKCPKLSLLALGLLHLDETHGYKLSQRDTKKDRQCWLQNEASKLKGCWAAMVDWKRRSPCHSRGPYKDTVKALKELMPMPSSHPQSPWLTPLRRRRSKGTPSKEAKPRPDVIPDTETTLLVDAPEVADVSMQVATSGPLDVAKLVDAPEIADDSMQVATPGPHDAAPELDDDLMLVAFPGPHDVETSVASLGPDAETSVASADPELEALAASLLNHGASMQVDNAGGQCCDGAITIESDEDCHSFLSNILLLKEQQGRFGGWGVLREVGRCGGLAFLHCVLGNKWQ